MDEKRPVLANKWFAKPNINRLDAALDLLIEHLFEVHDKQKQLQLDQMKPDANENNQGTPRNNSESD